MLLSSLLLLLSAIRRSRQHNHPAQSRSHGSSWRRRCRGRLRWWMRSLRHHQPQLQALRSGKKCMMMLNVCQVVTSVQE